MNYVLHYVGRRRRNVNDFLEQLNRLCSQGWRFEHIEVERRFFMWTCIAILEKEPCCERTV
jgi:hypothetical protein